MKHPQYPDEARAGLVAAKGGIYLAQEHGATGTEAAEAVLHAVGEMQNARFQQEFCARMGIEPSTLMRSVEWMCLSDQCTSRQAG